MAARGIERAQHLMRNTRALEFDDGKRDRLLAGSPRIHHNDRDIRDITVGNGKLLAAYPAVCKFRRDVPGTCSPESFGNGQRADDLPAGEFGQPGLLLRFGAEKPDRLGGKIDGGRERHRRGCPAQLLGDHAKLKRAKTKAAISLRDRRSCQPHLDKPFPDFPGVRLVAVKHAARN